MIALGIDGGLATFGWARVDLATLECSELGLVRTRPSDAKLRVGSVEDSVRRLRELDEHLRRLFGEPRPAVVCFERFSPPRNSGAAAKVAMAWGAAIVRAGDTPLVQLSPQQVRQLLGLKKSAPKVEVHGVVDRALSACARRQLAAIPEGMREHPLDALAATLAAQGSEVFRAVQLAARVEASARQLLGPADDL